MGPSALRIANLTEKLNKLGYTTVDEGDIAIEIIERQQLVNPKLRYLDEILKTSEVLAAKVEAVLEQGHFPLCLGGDHSMALGTIAGISSHCKKNNLSLGVIWIDAHPDMNTDETTPSGNIHGMPLSASFGIGHESLTDFYGFTPKLKPEHTVIIGARDIDEPEKEIIRQAGVKVYTMTDIDRMRLHTIINRVLRSFKGKVDHIHVSFDIDSVDPGIAPGVGTPVAGGLSYREAHLLMETIAECDCMSSLEVAEVNPILDANNQTAEFTADLIASSLGKQIL